MGGCDGGSGGESTHLVSEGNIESRVEKHHLLLNYIHFIFQSVY